MAAERPTVAPGTILPGVTRDQQAVTHRGRPLTSAGAPTRRSARPGGRWAWSRRSCRTIVRRCSRPVIYADGGPPIAIGRAAAQTGGAKAVQVWVFRVRIGRRQW